MGQKDTLLQNEYKNQARLKTYLKHLTNGKKPNGNHIVLHKKVQKFDVNDSGYAIERNGTIVFYGQDGSQKRFQNIGEPGPCMPSWHLHDSNIHFFIGSKRILIRLQDRKRMEVEIREGIESTCCEGGIITFGYLKDGTSDQQVVLYGFDNPEGLELYKGRLWSWNAGPSYIALQLEVNVKMDEFNFYSTFQIPAARIIPFSKDEKQRIVHLGKVTQFFICGKYFIVSLDRSKGVSRLADLVPIAHGFSGNGCEAKLFDNWVLHNTKFGVCDRKKKTIHTINLMTFSGDAGVSFSIKDIQIDGEYGQPKMNDLGYYQLVEGELRLYPFVYEWYDFGLDQIPRALKRKQSNIPVIQD